MRLMVLDLSPKCSASHQVSLMLTEHDIARDRRPSFYHNHGPLYQRWLAYVLICHLYMQQWAVQRDLGPLFLKLRD